MGDLRQTSTETLLLLDPSGPLPQNPGYATVTMGSCLSASDMHTLYQAMPIVTRKPSWRKGYARQRRHSKRAAIPRWPSPAILDIIEPEIGPFDPPTPKTLAYRTRHGVDRMHRLRDIRL